MKTLSTVGITLAAIILLSFGYILTGWYNIAATDHHNALTLAVLDMALERSVAHYAKGLSAPANLQDSTVLRLGATHYDQMCKGCHGEPGVNQNRIVTSMYPEPPNLSKETEEWSSEQYFWIIKNGIKMTGMPAFGSTHDDEEIWAITGFTMALPKLTPDQYKTWTAGAAETEELEHHEGEEHEHQH